MEISVQRAAAGGSRPVYRQIADQLRAEITRGSLAPGARLPTIRALARRLEVNRDTVALAYEELARSGVVESAVGRGTFVAPQGGPGGADAEPYRPAFSNLTRRLLDFERARPRFGVATDAVPMHALVPDPSLYPADAFRRALDRSLANSGGALLLYGGPQGHLRLREVLAERFARAQMPARPDEIVLCHGASQGISLALRLFAEPGDVVALEAPTYNNALAATIGLGLETAQVPMRKEGPDLDALERTLARPEVKLFYTIPTFHNPMGTTTRLAHRRALLEIAGRHRKPVIEDGYEMDLRISGRADPPLAGLDRSGLVVHLFSFSKSLFPGARVGAITARGASVEALLALKQATDLSDAMPLQAALAEFVASGDYDRHLTRLRGVLRRRRDALIEALAAEMPPGTRWTEPEGGYQVWVELPEGFDTAALLPDAVAAGVLFAPGSQFHADGRTSRCLRLTFSMAGEDALRHGVAALARVLKERLQRAPHHEPHVYV